MILALGTRFDDASTSSWLAGYTYAIPPTRLIQVDATPRRSAATTAGLRSGRGRANAPGRARPAGAGDRRARPDAARTLAGGVAAWAQGAGSATSRRARLRTRPVRPAAGARRTARRAARRRHPAVSDVGAHHNWIVQEWQPGGPGRCCRAGASPPWASVWPACSAPGSPRPDAGGVAVVGDGGFLMLPSVVATAVEYGLPAVWLVWNNGGYISIRDQQRGYFGAAASSPPASRYAATGEPYRCDFAAMARSMGADGMRAETAGRSRRGAEDRPGLGAADGDRRPGRRGGYAAGRGHMELPPLPTRARLRLARPVTPHRREGSTDPPTGRSPDLRPLSRRPASGRSRP